jgi:hypothetical protein
MGRQALLTGDLVEETEGGCRLPAQVWLFHKAKRGLSPEDYELFLDVMIGTATVTGGDTDVSG